MATNLINAAPEDHPLNDYDIGGVHYAGPEALTREGLGSDPLAKKLDHLKQRHQEIDQEEIAHKIKGSGEEKAGQNSAEISGSNESSSGNSAAAD